MWHWVAWLSAFVFNFQYLMSRLLLQLLMNHTPFYFDFLQSLHQLLHKLSISITSKYIPCVPWLFIVHSLPKPSSKTILVMQVGYAIELPLHELLLTTFTNASSFFLHVCFTIAIQPFLAKQNASFGYIKPSIKTICCLLMLIYFST